MTISVFRLKVITLLFLLYGLIIVARLFTWQVLRGDALAASAHSQQQTSSSIPAERGSILANDNFPLASSSTSWLVWASLPKVKDKDSVAHLLAPITLSEPFVDEADILKPATSEPQVNQATDEAKVKENLLKEEEERLKKLLTKQDVVWVALRHKLPQQKKEEIEKLKIEGLGFDPEEVRAYPEKSMASHLLGFVGQDAGGSDKGYFGLEGYYNLSLQGSRGEKAWEKDASGKPILLGDRLEIDSLNGVTLKTHIDRSVQFILEKHLKAGVQKYLATGGTVIVMRPQDGAIIGMASFPSYDPGRFNMYKNDRFIDPGVSQSFEPGSIFKVLVMSAALDAGVVEPDTKCDNCAGPRHIAEYTIESGTKKYYPDTNMTEIIEHSDNIGMIWVAERLGFDKMYDYLTRFGIGKPTGVDLQGEISPSLRKKDTWGLIDLATASFGQGVAVTGMEMVRSVGAIANKGVMTTPQVVDKLIGDGWEEKIQPQIGEKVISDKAAQEITDMMVHNVDSRDDWDKPKDIKIAGKTGTAQVAIAGHYDDDKTVASFIGYAPAYSPKYVMLVSLKDPKAAPFASQTAAPLWFAISKDLLPYLGALEN